MDIVDLELEDMEDISGSKKKKKSFSILNKDFLERTATGTYELIEGNRYDLHKDWNRDKCAGGTENTNIIAHLKHDERGISFWVALCRKHYQKVKNNNELDVLSDTRQP